MASQVFYRKWRPQALSEIVGQEPITQTLRNAITSQRISHAYLFCGPRGTGKTSVARILAKAVNCLSEDDEKPCNACSMCQAITEIRAFDVIEIDAASNTGVDDIRSLREKVNYAPNQARYKVYIIDEVHMLSTSAANALLKTLEEPPSHVIFVLATTEVHKIIPTILSRCQRFDFRRLSQANIVDALSRVCHGESIKIDDEAMRLVARSATGSMRDALNILEQLTTFYGNDIVLEQVKILLGITGDWRAKELVKNIINNDIAAGMATINSVNSDGLDLKQFNRELVDYLRGLLLIKTGSNETLELVAEEMMELKDMATEASLQQILRAIRLFGELEIGFDSHATLPLELALVDYVLTSEAEPESHANRTTEKAPQVSETVAPPPAVSLPTKSVAEPVPDIVPVPESSPDSVPVSESVPKDVPEPEPAMPVAINQPLESGDEIERLRSNWKQVIEQAPQDTKRTPAIAILRSAGVKPMAIENETVILAFRYTNHKELIEKIENQQVAEKIIGNYLGHSCRVSCVLEDNHLLKAALKMGAQIIDVEEK